MQQASANNDANIEKSLKVILLVLAAAPVVYGLLIYLLQIFNPPESVDAIPNELIIYLPIVLLIIAVVQIFGVYQVFIPKLRTSKDQNEVFSLSLYSAVMIESIGIYGLLVGLFDLYIIGRPVVWSIVGIFIIVSVLLQVHLRQNIILPRLERMGEQSPMGE